jgi:ribonucleoside-diphosphate reductase beta chain
MTETYANVEVLQRSKPIVDAFDRIAALPKTATTEEQRDAILLAFVALFALEAVAFMASFAVTFAIAERGVFQGIAQLVKLIARDEKLHTVMDFTILDILLKDPKWVACVGRNKHAVKEILDTVVLNELNWADYVFTEGRQVVGLTAPMLKNYVKYVAAPVYKALGVDNPYNEPRELPLPYMDSYLDSSKVQSANMEIQSGSYNVGALVDDTMDLDFNDL